MKEFTDTELAQEQWRDIDGYDGMYQVSDLGRVRSRYSGEWRVLRPGKHRQGYLQVALCQDGKQKTVKIHRLVAQAFIPNDNIFNTQINHRNEDKEDNKVSNLEYCDAQYNLTYNDLHHRRNTKRRKIKDLYNPNLTYEQNLEIFRANGIECGEKTLWRLRNDIGLTKRPVRNTIKDLYRPDLSISDNIELFMANGISCSRCTICRLRKELGLTRKHKPYRPRKPKHIE